MFDSSYDNARLIAGDAYQVLNQMLDEVGPQPFVDVLAAKCGAIALNHTLNTDCGCGAEGHLDQIFRGLEEAIEAAKEAIRGRYLERYEQASFAQDVNGDLEEIEVVAQDDLDLIRGLLDHGEEE